MYQDVPSVKLVALVLHILKFEARHLSGIYYYYKHKTKVLDTPSLTVKSNQKYLNDVGQQITQ